MKTLRLFSVLVVLGLVAAACSPKDPAVLTKAEKEADQKRRNKANPNSDNQRGGLSWRDSDFVIVPPQSEVAFTYHSLDRQSQAVAFLKLANDLYQNNGKLAVDPCVRLFVEKNEKQWTANFDVKCVRSLNDGQSTLRIKGPYQMVIGFDDQGLSSVRVQSPRIDAMNGLFTALEKKGFAGDAKIQEQYDFAFARSQDSLSTFELMMGTVETVAVLSTQQVQTLKMLSKVWGSVELSAEGTGANVNLSSEFEFNGVIVNGKPNPKALTLALKPQGENFEVWGPCPYRVGNSLMDFQHTRDLIQNQLISYNDHVVTWQKPDGKTVQWNGEACFSRDAAVLPGLASIDWAQILLYYR